MKPGNMMKRTSAVILLLICVCFAYAVEQKVQINGVYFILNEEFQTAEVTFKGNFYYEFDEYQGDVVVPSRVVYYNTAYRVIGLSPAAFSNCKSLKSVYLPNTIRMISRECFKNCSALQSVVLPEKLEVIRTEAFANCRRLTTINFPSSITTICDKAFMGCKQLSKVYTLAPQISTCAFDATCTVYNRALPTQHLPEPEDKAPTIVSDVDTNIPQTDKHNETTLVVIIANEHYQEVASVPYAIHDGEIFYEYCIHTLGIPAEHIRFTKDATRNNMRRQLNWLSAAVSAFNGEAKVIFYYAGHGIPNESTKKGYLLPSDGFGDDINSAYALDDIYTTLAALPTRSVTVFLDACFSGSNRSGEMVVNTRGVALSVKKNVLSGNLLVFSATADDQTAYPINNEGHGMFTYYLLKKLQETKGDASMGEIVEYVQNSVNKRSILVNSKSQTPSINVSPAIGNDWKKIVLK